MKYRKISQNLDFRDSCHVLLPVAVYTYGKFGRIRGIFQKNLFFEIVAQYFYPKPYTNTASLVEYGGNIRKKRLSPKLSHALGLSDAVELPIHLKKLFLGKVYVCHTHHRGKTKNGK